jgi:DNA polymerase-3 subunit delta
MTESDKVFLLQGPEEGEKAAYVDRIIEKIRSKTGEQPEVLRHYGFEANLVDIVALLANGSLFSRHTVVILNNVEEIKKVEDINIIADYLSNPADDATLVLTTHTVNQMNKKITAKIPAKCAVIFWEMFENQRKGWLVNFFKNEGIRIEGDALDFFLEMVANNSRDVKQECGKLVLLFGQGGTITLQDLEKYLYHSREENVFTLFEHVAIRDFGASLEVLEKMLLSGDYDGVAVLGGLLFQVKRLFQIKLLSEKSYRIDEICAKLGIVSKRNQKTYLDAHRNYTFGELKSMLVLFAEFDVRVRSYRTDLHRLLLQMLLYYIIAKDGRIPQPAKVFGY